MTRALLHRFRPAALPRDDRASASFSLTDLIAALSSGFDHAQCCEALLDRREGRA